MYPLFESIKVENGVILNLDYHQQRVARSSTVQLKLYLNQIALPSSGVHKLRITYAKDRLLGFSITPYIYRKISTLALIIDNHIDYSAKSEDRSAIERLWAQRGQCDDILIVKNDMVTDTSFCNILLLDGDNGNWHTPSTPLLDGTCRARLLNQGIITATEIYSTDLKNYTKFMLINAFMDFDENRAEPLSL